MAIVNLITEQRVAQEHCLIFKYSGVLMRKISEPVPCCLIRFIALMVQGYISDHDYLHYRYAIEDRSLSCIELTRCHKRPISGLLYFKCLDPQRISLGWEVDDWQQHKVIFCISISLFHTFACIIYHYFDNTRKAKYSFLVK